MALRKSAGAQTSDDTDVRVLPRSTGGGSAATRAQSDAKRREARTLERQQQAAERVATATTQLASGITEAASAQEQLSRAMEQVGSGAQQIAADSQDRPEAMQRISGRLRRQMQLSKEAEDQVQALQSVLDGVALEINNLVDNVRLGAERQSGSVERMAELEQQAASINEAVKAVMRIADQTNLLVLNAAIEAGRAGKHGKGFAAVIEATHPPVGDLLAAGAGASSAAADVRSSEQGQDDETRQQVSFLVDGQEYAFDISEVEEIVRAPEHISAVPRTDAHVLGLINLRGQLLPLVSLRAMFEMADAGADEHQRVVVLSLSDDARAEDGGVHRRHRQSARIGTARARHAHPLRDAAHGAQ